MEAALLLAAAYLLGAIPSSRLAGRAAGVDLTRRGSGNLGGTNVFRVLGARWAVPVVVADVGKGFVPAWFFPVWDGAGAPEMALAYGLVAIAGHVWSVFAGFDGGKGVATSGGVVFALAPVAALVALLVWAGTALLTRTASVASLLSAAVLPVLVVLLDGPSVTVAFTAVLAGLVGWTHRGNIARLRAGRELGFGEEGGADRSSRETGAGAEAGKDRDGPGRA